MPPRNGYSRARSQSRRQTGWAFGPGGSAVTTFSSSITTIVGAGVLTGVDGNTVVRIRGGLYAQLSSVAAITDGFHVGFAIGICTVEAFAVGVTAVPSPIDDMAFDGWLYHRFFDVHAVSATIGDGVNANAVTFRTEVDTKAMRKLPDGYVLYSVVQTVEDGTATMDVFFDSRALFKLS